jgi:hypothetical protein
MPYYDEDTAELVYTSAESEPFGCPVCGAGLEFGDYKILDDHIKSPWSCPECYASGGAYDKFKFDGHRVMLDTLPSEIQQEYTAVKTMCINGPLRVGDLVLSTVDCDDFPCFPGTVTDICLYGAEDHDSDNEYDDIYVDFSGKYTERRKRELWEANRENQGCSPLYEDLVQGAVLVAPNCLLNITDMITEQQMAKLLDKREYAIQYAYQVVRAMVPDQCAA